jgi:hypothetical protein
MCVYTDWVQEIHNFFEKIKASNVQKFTNIVNNEFREMSFSFVAPDGYFWTLVLKN